MKFAISPSLLKAIILAEAETRDNYRYHLGTEQLLLGLMRQRRGVAARILFEHGVRIGKIRSAVDFIIGEGQRVKPEPQVQVTPRASKAIQLSISEAKRLGDTQLDTEHLLLGLMLEGGGIGMGALQSLGALPEKIRAEIMVHITLRSEATPLTEREHGPTLEVDEIQKLLEAFLPEIDWSWLADI